MIDDFKLIQRAKEVVNPRQLSQSVTAGGVGCALITKQGNVYVGVCIDTACSLGFCAEHNAIGNMITNGESKIESIVAINRFEKILAPCGRCREFIYQVDKDNANTRVILENNRALSLEELLPERG